MRDFTKTGHCLSGVHCNACRNDPAWRAVMAKSFVMPDKCPYPDKKKWIVPDNARAICEACDGRNCPNVSFCCGGKRTLAIRVPCPRGLWQMDKE